MSIPRLIWGAALLLLLFLPGQALAVLCTSNAECDDGDLCTVDICNVSGGCEYTSLSCDDGNACSMDSCNPSVGCVQTWLPYGYSCDDADPLTENDICNGAGACAGTPADADGDGIPGSIDNCPAVPNPDQDDIDNNGVGDACEACPAGTSFDSLKCVPCVLGTYQPSAGQTECLPAPAGSYVPFTGAVEPYPCPVFTYSDYSGAQHCTACPVGTSQPQEGQTSCFPDADYDFIADADDACPMDPDNDADGDGVCGDIDNCPAVANPDQFDIDQNGVGDACEPCPVGTFFYDGSACLLCAGGYYQDQVGATACLPAEPGSYVAGPGQETPTPCDVGTYQPESGQSACLPAPPGGYVDATGATDFLPCPVQTYRDTEGGTLCTPCTAGTSQTLEGQTGCFLDSDDDNIADAADSCPYDADNDTDGDGVCGDVDNCPALANADQADVDGDGTGDACDPGDSDNDGISDADEVAAGLDPANPDSDGDGVIDGIDPGPAGTTILVYKGKYKPLGYAFAFGASEGTPYKVQEDVWLVVEANLATQAVLSATQLRTWTEADGLKGQVHAVSNLQLVVDATSSRKVATFFTMDFNDDAGTPSALPGDIDRLFAQGTIAATFTGITTDPVAKSLKGYGLGLWDDPVQVGMSYVGTGQLQLKFDKTYTLAANQPGGLGLAGVAAQIIADLTGAGVDFGASLP